MVLPNRCCVRNSMICVLGRGGWVLYFYLCKKIDREQEQFPGRKLHTGVEQLTKISIKFITYFETYIIHTHHDT